MEYLESGVFCSCHETAVDASSMDNVTLKVALQMLKLSKICIGTDEQQIFDKFRNTDDTTSPLPSQTRVKPGCVIKWRYKGDSEEQDQEPKGDIEHKSKEDADALASAPDREEATTQDQEEAAAQDREDAATQDQEEAADQDQEEAAAQEPKEDIEHKSKGDADASADASASAQDQEETATQGREEAATQDLEEAAAGNREKAAAQYQEEAAVRNGEEDPARDREEAAKRESAAAKEDVAASKVGKRKSVHRAEGSRRKKQRTISTQFVEHSKLIMEILLALIHD